MTHAPLKCPNCGEFSNWNKVSKHRKGFSILKAGIGIAAVGPLGLLAGNLGHKHCIYHCNKCGYTNEYKN